MVVLDTDVWSFVFKRDSRAEQYRVHAAQDAWVAACALRHGYPLITHNAVDYAGVSGLTMISETP